MKNVKLKMAKGLAVVGFRMRFFWEECREFQEVFHFVVNATEVVREIAARKPLKFLPYGTGRPVEFEKLLQMRRGTDPMLVADARDALAVPCWDMERLDEVIPHLALLASSKGGFGESLEWSHRSMGGKKYKSGRERSNVRGGRCVVTR